MNNEKDEKKSASEKQPGGEEVVRAEPGRHPNPEAAGAKEAGGNDAEVIVLERPLRPVRLELKGPPGMAVSVSGDERCTKIVLRLPMDEGGGWTP